jgi:hypothetical protein
MVTGDTGCSLADTRFLIIRHSKACVDLAGVAPGKAWHLCRYPLQLVGVGYDDRGLEIRFYPVPEQPGKRKNGNGRIDKDASVPCQRLEKMRNPKVSIRLSLGLFTEDRSFR